MTLAKLRALVTTQTPQGSSLSSVQIDTDDLLALLDAVEAAQRLLTITYMDDDEADADKAAFDAAVARLGALGR